MAASSWRLFCRALKSPQDIRFLRSYLKIKSVTSHFRRFSRLSTQCHAADSLEVHSGDDDINPLEMKRKDLRRMKMEILKSNWSNTEMERASREGTLLIPLKEVHKEWLKRRGASYIKTLAQHYGIFDHLFGSEEFLPQPIMYVNYATDLPIYYGTFIKPSEATSPPAIRYDSPEESWWTLLLTNPDGHLQSGTDEVLHWMIGNIPASEISDGETLCEYLTPVPVKGTGWHRFVFCLFEQTEKLDFSKYKFTNPCDISSRTFLTYQFMASYPNQLIPRAVNWFQAEWDNSVTFAFTHTLNLKEPRYETEKILTVRQKKQIEVRKARQSHYRDM